VELGPSIVQTLQGSFSHNIYVPRLILPGLERLKSRLTVPRTIVNVNASYTKRRDFFDLRSINASWGYDASWKNHSFQWIIANLELNDVIRTDSLNKLMTQYPTIAQAFNNQVIMSQILAYTTGNTHENTINFFRARLESSGAIAG